MVRTLNLLRPQDSPKGIGVSTRISNLWKGLGGGGGGSAPGLVDDFSSYALGTGVPEGWSLFGMSFNCEIVSGGLVGGQYLAMQSGSNVIGFIARDDIVFPVEDTLEIVMIFTHAGTGAGPMAAVRATSDVDYISIGANSGVSIFYPVMYKHLNGSYETNANGPDQSSHADPDTWSYLRAQIDASEIRVRIWDVGDPEPESWQLTSSSEPSKYAGEMVGLTKRTTDSEAYLVDYINIAAATDLPLPV